MNLNNSSKQPECRNPDERAGFFCAFNSLFLKTIQNINYTIMLKSINIYTQTMMLLLFLKWGKVGVFADTSWLLILLPLLLWFIHAVLYRIWKVSKLDEEVTAAIHEILQQRQMNAERRELERQFRKRNG